jgi:hypothetical protein
VAEDQTVRTDSGSNTAAGNKGTFVPLIFGGAVATALGFFAGQLEPVEEALGWSSSDDGLEQVVQAQADKISEQSDLIASLTERLDAIPEPAAEVDLSGIESQISGIEEQVSGAQTELAAKATALVALTERLGALEKRPMTEGLSEDAIAAYEAELEKLQSSVEEQRSALTEAAEAQRSEIASQLDEQRAEIASLLDEARNREVEAEEQAMLAQARAAMAKIIAAVDTGEPYADALADLQAAGGAEVPEALVAAAENGVPTLASLQTDVSGVVRNALKAARTEQASSGESGGLGSFLQRQLGARSVTPQEGDDPDAVLSRVEDNVRKGQLNTALTEIDKLPAPAQDAMGDWLTNAKTRDAATAAADELMTVLSTN